MGSKPRLSWIVLPVVLPVLLAAGCERATAPLSTMSQFAPHTPDRYLGSTNEFTTMISGQEFYGDDAESELIPTSPFQARIENQTSTVTSITCDYNTSQCTGQYRASHLGMWHTTSQTMAWQIRMLTTETLPVQA